MTTNPVAELAAALTARKRVKVNLDELLAVWQAASPHTYGHAEHLQDLAAALSDLADDGTVVLPSARSYDKTTRPHLPRFITVPAARREPRPRTWQHHPWRPELGWVASLPTLTDTQFDQLRRINTWLAHPDDRLVPVRHRSAEILGDEKALDGLAKSGLFGPERITHELLRCVYREPPMPIRDAGAGPTANGDVIVIENADSFWLTKDVLDDLGDPRLPGRIALGWGGVAPASIIGLSNETPTVGRVHYWGDLDPTGVSLCNAAIVAAKNHGLDAHPARALWEAMAKLEPTRAGTVTWPATAPCGITTATWSVFAAAGGRVAQERLAYAAISAALQAIAEGHLHRQSFRKA